MINSLSQFDTIIIAFYFLTVAGAGLLVTRKDKNVVAYFLAGRSIGWLLLAAALYFAFIDLEILIGLSGLRTFFPFFVWLSLLMILALGFGIGPLYLKKPVTTSTEFLEPYLDKAGRFYIALIVILMGIVSRNMLTLYASRLFLLQLNGLDVDTFMILIVMVAGTYTIIGGLKAVLYTQLIQALFLLAAVLFVLLNPAGFAFDLDHFGTWVIPTVNLKSGWGLGTISTGLGFFFMILSYCLVDQFVLQRVLCAKNVHQVKKGALLAVFVKLCGFVLLISGFFEYFRSGTTPIGTFATVMSADHPVTDGKSGFLLTGVLAILMTILASSFHSSATLFTFDFYRYFRPQPSERQLVLVGRLAATALVVLTIFWIPFLPFLTWKLVVHLLLVPIYLLLPVVALLLISRIRNANPDPGALRILVAISGLGLFILLIKILVENDRLGHSFLHWIAEFNEFQIMLAIFFLTICLFSFKRMKINTGVPLWRHKKILANFIKK